MFEPSKFDCSWLSSSYTLLSQSTAYGKVKPYFKVRPFPIYCLHFNFCLKLLLTQIEKSSPLDLSTAFDIVKPNLKFRPFPIYCLHFNFYLKLLKWKKSSPFDLR